MLSWSFYASLRSGSEWRSFQRGEWRKVHQSKVTVTRNMSNSWINPGWIVVYPSWSNESFHFQDTKCNFLMQCLRWNRASLRQMDTFKFHVLLVFFPKNLRKVLRVTSTWSVGVVDFWSAGWCITHHSVECLGTALQKSAPAPLRGVPKLLSWNRRKWNFHGFHHVQKEIIQLPEIPNNYQQLLISTSTLHLYKVL